MGFLIYIYCQMIKQNIIILLLVLGFVFSIKAQDLQKIEKLKNEIASCKEDTMKVKKLIKLGFSLSNYQFKEAVEYATQAYKLSRELHYTKGELDAYNSLADSYWFHSDYEKAQQYYFKAYRISDSIHDIKSVAFSLYNIGWILCIQQHSYSNDKYLYKSLQLYEQLKDTFGLLRICNALASYYSDRYTVKDEKQYFDSSLSYFKKGIEISKIGKLPYELGRIYGNMGDLFYVQKDFKTAIYYNEKSYEIHQKSKDSSSMMICTLNLAMCDLEIGNISNAILRFNKVFEYNERHDIKDVQLGTLQGLSKAYYKSKNYQKAYDFYEKFVELKSKLDKEAYSTSISNLQSNYSLEKSEANVAQLKQSNEIQELKNKKNKYLIIALLGVAFVVMIVAVLLFKQNKQKQVTNIQLKEQNHIIAEKKQEIDNSIQYAKGIQQAILPDIKDLKDQFQESFVYYKPKDVVSGDFYWFTKVNDDFYCIAADCTGHGVPGALMSIIAIDKIVQAVFEKKISNPSLILSFLNLQIKKVLKQHSDESKQMDGMDIALLKFNQTFSEVEFAGANRPLIIIRDKQAIEYKADKTAIAGFTADHQEFTSTKIHLQKNDSLFIFTDGYADQFGGDAGKKFMSKNLKDLLISIAELSANEQKQKIESAFNLWKKSYEQVDDVLVIGVKI